jgi:hypothetical protein
MDESQGTPQSDLPRDDERTEEQQESPSGGADSPEDSAEQKSEDDTGGTAGGTDDDGDASSPDKSEAVEAAEKAEQEAEEAKQKVKELEEDPPEKLEDWPDDKAKYETFGGAEGDESYEESVTSKLGPSSLRHREDGSVEIEGEEVDDPEEFKGDPIPGGPTDPKMSDSRAYGEPDLTDETSQDVKDEGDSEESGGEAQEESSSSSSSSDDDGGDDDSEGGGSES